MLKCLAFVFVLILLLANSVFAAKFNIQPRNAKTSKTYLPVVTGYSQVKYEAGGGSTLEAISFGDIFVGVEGKLGEGISYKTEFNLQNVATGGAISLGEVYLDIPNLIGEGNVFRFGRFRIPFGHDLFQSSREKPDIADAFYKNCFWSDYDFGIQNYSKIKEGSYELAVINGEGMSTDSSKSKDFVGRYIIKKGKELEIGLSEYLGNYNNRDRNNFGIFLKSKQGDLTGLFEYVNGTDKMGINRTLDFYNVVVRRLSPKLEGVFVYESWDPNIDVAGDHILAYTFGINFFKTPKLRFSSNARIQQAEGSTVYSKSFSGMVQVQY